MVCSVNNESERIRYTWLELQAEPAISLFRVPGAGNRGDLLADPKLRYLKGDDVMTTIDIGLAMPSPPPHTMEQAAKHESRKCCLQSGIAKATAND